MSAADIVEGGAVDMLLWCPECGMQHVDEPGGEWDGEVWRNPHHRSHLCSECGCIWRPADVPTNGVRSTGTAGKMDTFLHKAETEIRPMRLELERTGVAEIAALSAHSRIVAAATDRERARLVAKQMRDAMPGRDWRVAL